MSRLAIDLGTTNCQISTLNEAGEPVLIDVDGLPAVPSFAYVDPQGGLISVGRHAQDCWSDPEYDVSYSFRRWKLRIAEAAAMRTLSLGGGTASLEVTPLLLSAQMVRHLVEQATAGLGGIRAEEVLATVPHGWRRLHPERCSSTLEAVRRGIDGLGPSASPATLSEPVAAAAYWIWAAGRNGGGEGLKGGYVLVCDMGGGTFDLSLVRVGEDLASLDVVDAVNNNFAGDFADALLCVDLAREVGNCPGVLASPEGVLSSLDDPDLPWLRAWFRQASSAKESLSLGAERAAVHAARRMATRTLDLSDRRGGNQRLRRTLDQLLGILGPFFQCGRELVEAFLGKLPSGSELSAVAFAGGGSRIAGMRDEVVARQLRESIGEGAARVVSRLACSPVQIDKAVALGAALVANGTVRITERLLHDVGFVVTLTKETSRRAGWGESDEVLVTPRLRRGSPTPALFEEDLSASLGVFIEGNHPKLHLRVVVEDSAGTPRELSWETANPSTGAKLDVVVGLRVDGNGMLALDLTPKAGGRGIHLEAPLGSAAKTGGAGGRPLRRMTPGEFRHLIQGAGRATR